MRREAFKVIGGERKTGFLESGCTKTRLTGVAGLYMLRAVPEGELMEFFCIDFEKEGLKGYKSLLNGSEAERRDMMKEAIGVYGEVFESLTEAEALDLLNLAYRVTLDHHLDLPGDAAAYAGYLDRSRLPTKERIRELETKLSKTMETDFEAVNYYMNRALSGDKGAERQLLVTEQRLDLVDLSTSMVMLKNEIRTGERFKHTRYYQCRALTRSGIRYRLVFARIGVMDTAEGIKIASAEFMGDKALAVKEASMIIRRPEYLLVYQVANPHCFDEALLVEKPCVERESHEKGRLYIQFNRSNAHYKEQVYYMNDDIFGLYFLMDEGRLIAATFSKEGVGDVNGFLSRPCFKDCLKQEQAFYTEKPLFYQIVHQEEE